MTARPDLAAHVPAPPAAAGAEAAQFIIPAVTSLQEQRTSTLKQGDAFAVFDAHGDALAGSGSAEGVYYRDTRHLSHLQLALEGQRPMLLSSTLRDDNATLTCDLTNPDLLDGAGRLLVEHDLVHLRRSLFLWNAACYERLVVRSFADRPQRLRIDITFAADFADLFEVRGTRRERRGELQVRQVARVAVVHALGASAASQRVAVGVEHREGIALLERAGALLLQRRDGGDDELRRLCAGCRRRCRDMRCKVGTGGHGGFGCDHAATDRRAGSSSRRR
jgi:hypothetical protein